MTNRIKISTFLTRANFILFIALVVVELFALVLSVILVELREFIIYYVIFGLLLVLIIVIDNWPPSLQNLDAYLLIMLFWLMVSFDFIFLLRNRFRFALKY